MTDSNCKNNVVQLKNVIDSQLDYFLGVKDVELQVAAANDLGSKSGGLWSDISSTLDDTFKSIAGASVVEDINTSYKANLGISSGFDPSGFSSSLIGGDIPGAEVSSSLANEPKLYLSSHLPLLSVVKPSGDNDICGSGSIIGTASGVFSAVKGVFSTQLRKISGSQSLLKASIQNLDGFTDGLFNVALNELNKFASLEETLLDQITKILIENEKILQSLSASDYLLNRNAFIEIQKRVLMAAEVNIFNVKRQLQLVNTLNQEQFLQAKNRIKAVREALCGLNIDFNISGLARLALNFAYLTALYELWLDAATRAAAIDTNARSFGVNLSASLQFDSPFGPVIDLIQCKLRSVIGDMSATQRKNVLINTLLREKKWCVELLVLEKIMSGTQKLFKLTDKLAELNKKIIDFGVQPANASLTRYIPEISASYTQYLADTRRKLTSFVYPSNVILIRGSTLQTWIKARKAVINARKSFISDFISDSTADVLKKAALAYQVIDLLRSDGLNNMAQDILNGDLASFFKRSELDASSSLSSSALLASVTNCAPRSTQERQNLVTLNTKLNDADRSTVVFNDVRTGYNEAFSTESVLFEIPDAKNTSKLVNLV